MIDVQWINPEHTLLKWVFGQQWSRKEFLDACVQSQQMVSAESHTVNIVVDISVTRIYPPNVIYLALTGMRMKCDNTGQIIVISSSNLWVRLYGYIKRVYPTDVIPVDFVDSYHDAAIVLDLPFEDTMQGYSSPCLPAYTGKSIAPFYQS